MKDNTFDPREDSATMFRVEDRKSDRHPEFEGEFKIRCPHCQQASTGWIKAWVKEAKNGRKFFGFAFKHRQSRAATDTDANRY